MFTPVNMPALGGVTEWLNSEPLRPAELRGRVALWLSSRIGRRFGSQTAWSRPRPTVGGSR